MPISFEDFSEIWSEKFYSEQVPQRHFLTLPQISDIFVLAILSHIKSLGAGDKIMVIELGAGDGDLARKIIDYSRFFHLNFEKLVLVEKSQNRVKNILKKLEGYEKIISISDKVANIDLCELKKSFSIIIANEFFDSLPFSVIRIQNKKVYELFVNQNDAGGVKVEFGEPREKVLKFLSEYLSRIFYVDDLIFEVSPSFDIVKNLKWSDYIIISDYGYRYFEERSPFGSVSIHYKFWVERLDFLDIPSAEEKINKFFGKGDVSFFVDFEILEKILNKEGFSTEVSRLSSFVFSNLQSFKEIVEEFLKDRKQNIISFSDIMSRWGNFFVLTAFRKF